MRVHIRSRLVSLTTAAVVAPVLVAMPAPVQATPAPVPVTPTTKSAPLLAPTNAAVGRDVQQGLSTTTPTRRGALAAAGAQGAAGSSGSRLLGATAVTPVTSAVTVVGLTWQENTGTTAVVQIRSRVGSTWSAWQTVETDPTRGESDSPQAASNPRAGTDPIPLTGVNAVQARVLGHPSATPVKAELQVIDPGESSFDATAGTAGAQPGAAQAVAGRPALNARASWGANENMRRSGASYGAVKGVVVHHTAGTNNYSPSQVPAILRGIYAFHVRGRGWNDIAYNALVDKWGRVWEGRYGGLTQATIGAHTLGYNGYTTGISVLGDYTTAKPSTAALDSVARFIAWKAGVHQFAPNGATNLFGRKRPVVVGHRDVGQTTCPGTHLYAKLGWIRSRAAQLAGYNPALTLPRDVDHQGGSDVPALRSDGSLALFSAGTNGSMRGPRRVGPGWRIFNQVMAVGDFDSDGDDDLIGRHASTGQLLLYRNNSRGGFGRAEVVGFGWSGFTHVIAAGDVSGDGRPDLVAQTRTGALMIYPGNGRGGFGRGVTIPARLPVYRLLVGVGDWDGDRRPDLIAVAHDGSAYQLRDVSPRGIGAVVRLSGDFSSYQQMAGVADTDGDGATELFAVDHSGSALLGRRTGTTTVSWTSAGVNTAGTTLFSG